MSEHQAPPARFGGNPSAKPSAYEPGQKESQMVDLDDPLAVKRRSQENRRRKKGGSRSPCRLTFFYL
jgi:hypothetical protein